jgi:membrane protein
MTAMSERTLRERLRAAARVVDRALPDRLSSLLRRFADRDILLTASSLAFYGVVSALPLLMLAFAAVEALAGEDTLLEFAERAAGSGPEGTGAFLEPLVSSGGSLTVATVLFTLWPATAYGGGLRRALSHQTVVEDPGAGPRGRLTGIGLVLVLPVLLLAGIPLMFVLSNLAGDGTWGLVLGWAVALAGGGLLATVLTTLVYQAFAPATLGWRESVSGAALTAVTTAMFSLLFVVYLDVADIEERFGGGATAVVVLMGVWLFAANILLLAGYQVVLELHERRRATQVDTAS